MASADNTVDTPSRNNRVRAWCFTWNNYSADSIEYIISMAEDTGAQYIFGEEVGESGTPHLQGTIRWKNAKAFNVVRKLLEGCHITPCRNWFASCKYCAKDGKTYANVKAENPDVKKITVKTIENLYPWQQQIVDEIAEEPDDRKIVWIYDEEGCKGKTALCKYLCVRDSTIITISGKASDAKYAITQMVTNEKNPQEPRAVLFHFTRSNEQFVSYEAIEAIKDGIFFNTKYESKQVVYNCPHVYVFANFKPEESKLSRDRWVIRDLNQRIDYLDPWEDFLDNAASGDCYHRLVQVDNQPDVPDLYGKLHEMVDRVNDRGGTPPATPRPRESKQEEIATERTTELALGDCSSKTIGLIVDDDLTDDSSVSEGSTCTFAEDDCLESSSSTVVMDSVGIGSVDIKASWEETLFSSDRSIVTRNPLASIDPET